MICGGRENGKMHHMQKEGIIPEIKQEQFM